MRHILPSYITTREHSATTILPSDADRAIAAYLSASLTDASLHPDSVMTPHGLTFSATSGSQGGPQLRNLGRIVKGLRGETLHVEPDELLGLKIMTSARAGDFLQSWDGQERVLDGDVWRVKLREGRGLDGIGRSRDRSILGTRGVAAKPALKKGSSFSSDVEELEGEARDGKETGAARLERIAEAGEDASAGMVDGQKNESESEEEEWQDAQEFAESREVLEGEVGDRDGAPVVRQGDDMTSNQLAMTDEAGHIRKEAHTDTKRRRDNDVGDITSESKRIRREEKAKREAERTAKRASKERKREEKEKKKRGAAIYGS